MRVLKRLRGSVHEKTLNDLFGGAAGAYTLLQDEAGKFERAPFADDVSHTGWAWSNVLADLDLNGQLDIFCVNGFVTGDLPQET